MRLHDRYLFRELLTPLALCLGPFPVLGVSMFFKEQLTTIQEQKLSALETAAYCATSLPEFLVAILPVVLLLASLYALTHHARYNEITALRAAGVSLWRLCAPYFAVGLLATAAYFALNEIVVPNCKRWEHQLLTRHADPESGARPGARGPGSFTNARAHRLWKFADYDEQSTWMRTPIVEWTQPDHSWRLLRADHAVQTNGVWTFFDVQLFQESGPQTSLEPAGATNVLAMPEFDETPERIRLLLKFADTQTLHGSGNPDIPLAVLWEFMQTNPGLRAEDAQALQTKFYGRLASPWTCLVVVLVAIPFGAPSGRRNLFFGVAGSIFIGFAYFILQRVSLALGMNGQLPGWLAAWLPNLLFAAAGIILTSRVR